MEDTGTGEYHGHDAVLVEAHTRLRMLNLTYPENEREQKRAFLEDGQAAPRFVYQPLPHDFKALAADLRAMEFDDDDLGRLYAGVRDDLLLKTRIVLNRGRRDIVAASTRQLFGPVDAALAAHAEDMLKDGVGEREPEHAKTIPAEAAKAMFEESLRRMGLDDWQVELTPRFMISVIIPRRAIAITRDRMFSRRQVDQLLVHEIGVHVVRAANGARQPYRIFSIGLPGYGAAEEGAAIYVEELMKVSNEASRKHLASHVLAVKSLYDGLSFRETFEAMKALGHDDDHAWRITVRTHRAGGFARDHTYLKGYLELKKLFENSMEDFKYLFVGKVNVRHLDMVKGLVERGALHGPRFIPDYLERYFN